MSRRAANPRLQLVVVGRARGPFHEAIAEFEQRVDRRVGLRVDEVNPEPLQRGEAWARAQEAARIDARLLPAAHRVALDPAAAPKASSEAFARWLGGLLDQGRQVAFVVGGASGIDAELLEACDARMGLGPLTMPHQLARLVLTEQIYRALCILDGHPYPH